MAQSQSDEGVGRYLNIINDQIFLFSQHNTQS